MWLKSHFISQELSIFTNFTDDKEFRKGSLMRSIIGIRGVHISSNFTLQMYGDARAVYKTVDPVYTNKFTVLRFDLDVVDHSEELLVCLFENEEEIGKKDFLGDEQRCANLPKTEREHKIAIGKFFDYRRTSINYIAFVQNNTLNTKKGESKFTNITFREDIKEDLFDTNGKCRDENASKIPFHLNTTESARCECNEHFVSSNGGKVLGEYDSCVRCLGCALDGEQCTIDRDCMMGTCVEKNCVPGVSFVVFVMFYLHLLAFTLTLDVTIHLWK